VTVDKLKQSYEDVPYASLSYPQTHPDRLRMLAMLMGMEPAPLDGCRVLELGCAVGGNIIPMAYGLPESSFLGIDFSPGQIKTAQSFVDGLELKNIQLMQADILSLSVDIGKFDFIIAHGVYSWTPANVREKVMEIFKNNLAANGVAYLSFNAYPGWHMQGAMRNMMRYHTREIDDNKKRLDEAQHLIGFLAKSVDTKGQYGVFLNAYQNLLNIYNQFDIRRRKDVQDDEFGLIHDDLGEVNDAFYFNEVITHASQHGLQYLIGADYSQSVIENLKSETAETLLDMSDNIIEMEQYLDFLRNNNFRQILLCHEEIDVKRSIKPNKSWLHKFYAAIHTKPDMDNDALVLRGEYNKVFSTDHPVSQAALVYLHQVAPKSIQLQKLLEQAVMNVYEKELDSLDKSVVEQETKCLLDSMFTAFSKDMILVEFRSSEPDFVITSGEKPLASHLARWQVQQGCTKVTNSRHETLALEPMSAFLLPYLNGENDRDALLTIMCELVQKGVVTLANEEGQVTGAEAIHTILTHELEKSLRWLGRVALLES